MLEQKADFLKFDSNYSTLVLEQQYKNVNKINRTSQLKNIFIICTKTFIQYQRHHCNDGLRHCGCFITFTTFSTTTVI